MLHEYSNDEKLLTKGEVARLCRVDVRTVDRWLTAGRLSCHRTPSGRALFRSRTCSRFSLERRRSRLRASTDPADIARHFLTPLDIYGHSSAMRSLAIVCARSEVETT